SDPTISGGFKHVFAAVSKGFPSHPAYSRHFPKAREKRLFATPSLMDRLWFLVKILLRRRDIHLDKNGFGCLNEFQQGRNAPMENHDAKGGYR
ncbi:MAG: hypothetical protein AB1547_10990, partial [Thermodesulfobacteriota bacterium]